VRLAGHFAKQSMAHEDKLAPVKTQEATTGAAILSDAVAFFDCELSAVHEAGDHYLVVGRVVDAGVLNDREPLVAHAGAGLRYVKQGPR
jgi:3-hydroxy-9,10-secoandrosta-1,3,5(10)-triene-9,17-dione monooxygenase reductase component